MDLTGLVGGYYKTNGSEIQEQKEIIESPLIAGIAIGSCGAESLSQGVAQVLDSKGTVFILNQFKNRDAVRKAYRMFGQQQVPENSLNLLSIIILAMRPDIMSCKLN